MDRDQKRKASEMHNLEKTAWSSVHAKSNVVHCPLMKKIIHPLFSSVYIYRKENRETVPLLLDHS